MKEITIADRIINENAPCFIVAEMSANHNQNFDQAVVIVKAAKDAGADAIKLQTYTPETITLDSAAEYFQIQHGTLWDGQTLYNLYKEAYTPWEWQSKLKKVAEELGLIFFSSPFDKTAVDFLEEMNVPAYKIASPEITDIPLIEYIASKGKPVIISTGMATFEEIQEAVEAARNGGAKQIALLKCTSTYPAKPEEMNLRTIPYLAETFQIPIGLSDHTLGIAVPVAAISLGASIIEKHFTLSRSIPGPDSAFSLEPQEFKSMVEAIRTVEKALGEAHFELSPQEVKNRAFRRSLFVVKDMKAGEIFTDENVRSIRPAQGLLPKYLQVVLGRRAAQDITRGTPLNWQHVGK